MPPASEYERLKRSIKEEGGLLVPVVLNQDNVVLDGHHRLQACAELDIHASCLKKDFRAKGYWLVSYRLDRGIFEGVICMKDRIDERRSRLADILQSLRGRSGACEYDEPSDSSRSTSDFNCTDYLL
jgi:hypothetical protein